ncbi:MAG: HAD family hydrolase [Blautia sp.]|nr:HAD family hydrolase [Blautia sp.]
MDTRLIALDMDGTLLDSRKQLPPDFIPWVKAHPQYRIAIASGRQFYTLWDEFEEIAPQLIIIAENGSYVTENKEVIFLKTMEKEDVRACLDICMPLPGTSIVLSGVASACMRTDISAEARRQGELYYHRLVFQDDLYAYAEQDGIIKVSLYIDDFKAAETAELIKGLNPRIKAVVSGRDWIDIIHSDVSKGTAMEAVQRQFSLTPDQCMAFGDYMNDYEMLKKCGQSFAMGNATQAIKEIARYETDTNDRDGVMKVLRGL